MFNFFKKIFNNNNNNKTSNNTNKTTITKADKITAYNNCISNFPSSVFLIIGKTGEGKTTLVQNIIKVLNKPVRLAENVSDLDANEDVIVLDNISSKIATSILNKVLDKIRVQRHEHKTYIITHHLLSQVPTQLIQLATKVIFFNSSFNFSAFTSKVGNLVSKEKIETLHKIVLELERFHYVIVSRNRISKVYMNNNVSPILNDFDEYNNSSPSSISNTSDDPETFVKGLEGLSNTQKIKALLLKYPEISNQKISELLNISPAIVKARKYYLKKHNHI
ncbi:MAG: hypothetical protein QXG39_09410 [Candidatus Aenigmatarchaeota archaeon]